MSTTSRGYGAAHQKARRAALAAMQDGEACTICAGPMYRGDALDLDHTLDRGGYRGLAHASCNRSDGARRSGQGRVWSSDRW